MMLYLISIPAFARMYNVSCNLCHIAYPKLNRCGIQFAENGYYFQERQKEVCTEVPEENLKPFKQPPLAFRLVQNLVAQYNKDDKKVFPDFQSPFFAKLFFGGALGKNLSFYSYIIFEEGEAPFFEDAWVELTPFHHHRAISDSGPYVFEGDEANGCGLLYFQTKSLSFNLP